MAAMPFPCYCHLLVVLVYLKFSFMFFNKLAICYIPYFNLFLNKLLKTAISCNDIIACFSFCVRFLLHKVVSNVVYFNQRMFHKVKGGNIHDEEMWSTEQINNKQDETS